MDQTLARTSQRIATWMEDTALPFLDAYLPHDVCMLALSRGDDPTPTASTPNARLPRAWILDSNRKSYVDFAAPPWLSRHQQIAIHPQRGPFLAGLWDALDSAARHAGRPNTTHGLIFLRHDGSTVRRIRTYTKGWLCIDDAPFGCVDTITAFFAKHAIQRTPSEEG